MNKPKLNSEIKKLLIDNNIPLNQGLAYLIMKIYNMDTTFIDVEVRQIMNILNIDYNSLFIEYNKGSLFPINTGKESKELFHEAVKEANTVLDFKSFISKYIDLFPKQSETGLSYAISGNTNACITRMKKFIKDFNSLFNVKYNDVQKAELIINATKAYLEERKTKRWKYTKKNSKFIYDNESSMLEGWCRKLLNNESTKVVGKIDFKSDLSGR